MGRIYSVPFQGTITTAGGDQDFIEIAPADDKPVKLRGWSIGNISDVKDAEEKGYRVSVILRHVHERIWRIDTDHCQD